MNLDITEEERTSLLRALSYQHFTDCMELYDKIRDIQPDILLFVYGTLKRGHGNHHLLQYSKFIAEVETEPEFRLYSGGIPYLIHDPKHGYSVSGELYKVDYHTLMRVDRLEGHPDHYKRTKIEIGNIQCETYIYTRNIKNTEELTNGEYTHALSGLWIKSQYRSNE